MITKQDVEGFKKIISAHIDLMPGMSFSITNREEITDMIIHPALKLDYFKVGMKLSTWGDRGAVKAMRTGMAQTEVLDAVIFGSRLIMNNLPWVDEDGQIGGTVNLACNHNNPVTNAFKDFAPMIAEMFPEGAGLYMTDLKKVVGRQDSSKFSIPNVQIGTKLSPDSVPVQAINKKAMVTAEIPKEEYGIPVLNVSYPLFDEDNKSQVIGTFGITIPKANAQALRDLSSQLNQSLAEIAAVIQELAASASDVMTNQHNLNQNVSEVSRLVLDINEILTLIKQIADETKMLGLNAAIEAARAGEAGAGFSVVSSEIRKLSEQSKDTVGRIRELTKNIDKKVQETTNSSQLNIRSSEEQAAATQEVSASIQELMSLAHTVAELARNMS